MSLFACSLAPFVSEALFNRNLDYPLWLGIIAALAIGNLIGLIFPVITAHAVNVHKGHNLFNAGGVSAGFLAFLLFTVYKTLLLRPLGLEQAYTLNSILSEGFPLFFFHPVRCDLYCGNPGRFSFERQEFRRLPQPPAAQRF